MVNTASLFFHHTQSRIGGVLANSSRLRPKPSLAEASSNTSSICSPLEQLARASLVRLAPSSAPTRALTRWTTGNDFKSLGCGVSIEGTRALDRPYQRSHTEPMGG